MIGLVVSSVLVSGLVLYNWDASFGERFTDIVLLATWMTLIAYAYAAAAEVILFFRDRHLFSKVRLVRDTTIASLAFAYSVWAIWGSGEEWLAKGFMLLLFGIPVFVWMKWRSRPDRLPPDFHLDNEIFVRHAPPPARKANGTRVRVGTK